ncbi:hypothetical protein SAMN04488061_0776 [Filomicrobium insigne]|uniref:Uncharacterized protein n=1 Tax=Filomicrobium insigne TaxID=418854 RepID=A0A1H0I8U4_9HYPH|nr:hypothetical protein SAMN04488061_0776 [Filomicrobium insigne]
MARARRGVHLPQTQRIRSSRAVLLSMIPPLLNSCSGSLTFTGLLTNVKQDVCSNGFQPDSNANSLCRRGNS